MKRVVLFSVCLVLAVVATVGVVLLQGSGACNIWYEARNVTMPLDEGLNEHSLTSQSAYVTNPVTGGTIVAAPGEDHAFLPSLIFNVVKAGEKSCRIAFKHPVTDIRFSSLAGKLPAVHYNEVTEVTLAETLPDAHTMSEAQERAKLGVQVAYVLTKEADGTRVYALRLMPPNTTN